MKTLPNIIPVFPLARALLLPGGSLPLVIFENRYLAMLKEALAGERVIAMTQPKSNERSPNLYKTGCLGRITSFNEIEGERMLITLTGISRFHLVREIEAGKPFRSIEVSYERFSTDRENDNLEGEINRKGLIEAARRYMKKNNIQADWDAIAQASGVSLVTAFSILSPFGVAEKQALLEAADSVARCELLIAFTEMAMAQSTPFSQLADDDELENDGSDLSHPPTLQ